MKREDIFLLGVGDFPKSVYTQIKHDSNGRYNIIGFINLKESPTRDFCELPVVNYSQFIHNKKFKNNKIIVCIGYKMLNTIRQKYINELKENNFVFASFIDSTCTVHPTAKIGKNVIIFEGNIIQHGVEIADGTVLSRGNLIGHDSTIKENVFIANRVTLCGYNTIGENCFIGSGATISDKITVGKRCIIGAQSLIGNDIESESVYLSERAKKSTKSLNSFLN